MSLGVWTLDREDQLIASIYDEERKGEKLRNKTKIDCNRLG